VRTLVDETRAAGPHRVDWDGKENGGRQAAAGIYMYRINAGDFTQQKKMTLLK
jgi:flagellar hook assembly protein FlgD